MARRNAATKPRAGKPAIHHPPPPPLPDSKMLTLGDKCVIEYVDVRTTMDNDAKPPITIVLVPGAPGTIRDFRYLMPLLTPRARVLSVNLPGYGASKAIKKQDYYHQIGSAAASQAVHEALKVLCKDDPNVFIVGHSFGGHTAINLTKLSDDHASPQVKGLALFASAGHRPHQTLVPRVAVVMTWLVRAGIPLISWMTATLLRWIMSTFIGFPRGQPKSYYVSSLVRQTTTNYGGIMEELDTLQHIPTFYAWSRNDMHIEEELSLALNERAGPGPRFAFEKGGHNIQKTRASFLAKEMLTWMENIVDGRDDGRICQSKTPQVLE